MAMKVTKAVITAAGPGQRTLPVQVLIDRDGVEKPLLRILVEEAVSAGIEEIGIVVAPGDEKPYLKAIGDHDGFADVAGSADLTFIPQEQPLGYGHAVYCARDFVGGEPFLHLVGDHLYVSDGEISCARQLVETATAQECAVSAVQATRESLLPYFGAIGGHRIQGRRDLYVVETVIEKPAPTEAELRLTVPGLRAGHYLCFFGMHVLTPTVMEILGEQVAMAGAAAAVTLSAALATLAERERYLAHRGARLALRCWRQVRHSQRAACPGAQRQRPRRGALANARVAGSARPRRDAEVMMRRHLAGIITSTDPAVRNRSLDVFCRAASLAELQRECEDLETLRHTSPNLYERVRALFFLYAIHRFYMPAKLDAPAPGLIPYEGYAHLLQRRFEEAIARFRAAERETGGSAAISSALAEAYRRLGLQTLADQVRRSVRSVRGNQWMFRVGHPMDQPLRVRRELLERSPDGLFPILHEATPVRMDFSHSAWSDIFFLGMDYPEGARVLNVSIDLAVQGRDRAPRPPVEAYFRVIDEPVLRLASVDLGATAEITSLGAVFDYAADYLGLLKAAIIASGLIPPGIEGSGERLEDLLARVVGDGKGIELVSHVNGIPKGSRLAVSTNLLASLIAVCMRATEPDPLACRRTGGR